MYYPFSILINKFFYLLIVKVAKKISVYNKRWPKAINSNILHTLYKDLKPIE